MEQEPNPAPKHGGNGATPPPTGDQSASPTDIFTDLDALKLDTANALFLGTTKHVVHVPIRRPSKTEFIRTHPEESYSLPGRVFEDREGDGRTYYVLPNLTRFLEDVTRPVFLVLAQNSVSVTFIWPVTASEAGGWGDSARSAAFLARDHWVRIVANRPASSYDVITAEAEIPPPRWPDMTFGDLLKVAFKGRVIDSMEHPIILRSVRGVQ